jgi:hypothetical protein
MLKTEPFSMAPYIEGGAAIEQRCTNLRHTVVRLVPDFSDRLLCIDGHSGTA